MHFGENVREIVSMSCGKDLRSARSRTVLPGIDSPEVQRRLAANLERSFDITLKPQDVEHLTTLRAVLQCVRLRRWERELGEQEGASMSSAESEDQASMPAPALRERFVRYAPQTSSSLPMPATTPSFALRKS